MTSGVEEAAQPAALAMTGGPHPEYPAREWYTSAEILELERHRLFDHSWALVGVEEDLAGPGSTT